MVTLSLIIILTQLFEISYSFVMYFMPVPKIIMVLAALFDYLPILVCFYLGTWLFNRMDLNSTRKLVNGLLYTIFLVIMDAALQIYSINYIQSEFKRNSEMTQEQKQK